MAEVEEKFRQMEEITEVLISGEIVFLFSLILLFLTNKIIICFKSKYNELLN